NRQIIVLLLGAGLNEHYSSEKLMNISKIKPLVKWLVEMGFTDIEIKDGEESLRLGRQAHQPAPFQPHSPAHIQLPVAAP
ncbi:hypothetical protein, partial [Vibrio vulnificus]|uniref:hypothetical protein n=1 Tax=Vibrio vulnificus TaxID=672 RepID=UPI0039B6A596